MSKLISVCGIDCQACECRDAYLANNEERKADIAERWSKTYNSPISAQDIACEGCMEGEVHFSWCGKCPICACAVGKGYQSCAECADFPCETNSWLYEQVPAAKATIEAHR